MHAMESVGSGLFRYRGYRVGVASARTASGRWTCVFTIAPQGRSIAIVRCDVDGEFQTRSMAEAQALCDATLLINARQAVH